MNDKNGSKTSTGLISSIVENMPGVLFQFSKNKNGEMKFIFVSSKIEELSGLSADRFISVPGPIEKFTHPEDLDPLVTQIAASAEYLTSFEWQGRIVFNNKTKWVHVKARPHRKPDDTVLWDGLLMDITIQHHMMDQFLQQKSRVISHDKIDSLNQMAAGIAHEINNPLTTANMNVQMIKSILLKSKWQDDTLEKCIRRYEQATAKISQVIGRLRQISRQKSGLDQKESLNLNDIVKNCLNHIKDYYQSDYNVKIVSDLSIDRLPVFVNETQIFQAILNLIANSKDAVANQSEKHIEVSTYSTPIYNYLKIKDNGVGIPKEILPKVFEPFYTTKHKYLNSGVGLSITGTILNQHNAIIDIWSSCINENPHNHGTEITIKFPLDPTASQSTNSSPQSA